MRTTTWRAVLVALSLAALATGCGGGEDDGARAPARGPDRPVSPATGAALAPEAAARSLAAGLTEPNPLLVWSPEAHAVEPLFAPWRDEIGRIRPAFYRLVIDWAALQPTEDAPPDLAAPSPGCNRAGAACGGYDGVREQLQALASRQREGGWEGVAVVTGAPDWAAGPPAGCERRDTEPRSRTPRPAALPAFERLVRAVLAEARTQGAELRWWSAWNEPNRYLTLSPQRALCRAGAPSVAADRYAGLVRALRAALDAAPGEQDYILGDLAGVVDGDLGATTVGEFVRALPDDLLCGTPVLALHGYVGSPDPVPGAVAALRRRDCPRPHTVWITQTGALGEEDGGRTGACRALEATLLRWYRDASVSAAFQYTAREDDAFPMGLVDADLTRAFPALRLWQAWGGEARPRPDAPPPRGACG